MNRLILGFFLFLIPTAALAGFDSGRADFSAIINEETADYTVTFTTTLPGGIVAIRPEGDVADYRLHAASGDVKTRHGAFLWRAPDLPRHYPLRLVRDDGAAMTVRVFVMVPADRMKNGRLNGYRIGDYPDKPLRGEAIYEAPEGFIEVTEETADLRVSPHFTLGQFLCKQTHDGPVKYILLRPALLAKLERILEKLNDRGFRADTLHVMSGFRTPAYNAGLGNVAYSRHLWGGAADIFIDSQPDDGIMDDINRDDRVNRSDARTLYEMVDRMSRTDNLLQLVGGLGEYGATQYHGPFIHVDVRGKRARWGYSGTQVASSN